MFALNQSFIKKTFRYYSTLPKIETQNFETVWNQYNDRFKKNGIIKSLSFKHYPLKHLDGGLKVRYYCKNEKCDFDEVIGFIQNSKELKTFHCNEVIQNFVSLLIKNPEDFLPAKMDGYLILKCGIEILRIENENFQGGSYSILDYDTLMKSSNFYW